MIQIAINQASNALRLDKFLCQNFDISFGLAQKLIREKKIKVNNKKVDPSYKTALEDEVTIFTDLKKRLNTEKKKPRISAQKIEDFIASIIYQDENLIAINKPSGLATQGGSGIEISVDDFLPYLKEKKLATNPQLIHRLDKDTSGILLIATNKDSAEFLTLAFKNKTIEKTYLALVDGILKKPQGTIKIALMKKFVSKNEKVYPDSEGKEAITNFKLLQQFNDFALVGLKPITGRTHQLRVHCKEIGHAIINDVKYGGKEVLRKNISNRMCLHAYKIKIKDYFGKELEIATDLPEFITKFVKKI